MQVFAENLQNNEVLCTAHHQEDQLETVLLQLLRGAGPKGLAAMSAFAPFAQGYHARPLLNVSHELILNYAKENNINLDYRTRVMTIRNLIAIFCAMNYSHIEKTFSQSL